MRYNNIFFLLIYTTLLPAQTRYHVDQNVSGGAQTGLDWFNAFPDFQQAIAVAQAGDTIWVADGVYKPTGSSDRTVSFELKRGVHWYGGFSGTETALEQRDMELWPTVLSGDIGQQGAPADNAYHVVYAWGADAQTRIDGFTIRDGYSQDLWDPNALQANGGGMLLLGSEQETDARPQIVHCIFENNRGLTGGALAVLIDNPDSGATIVPDIRSCLFSFNKTTFDGGAIYIDSETGLSDTLLFLQCHFLDNRSVQGNGGAISFNRTANSNTIFQQCSFERDSAQMGLGGVIYFPGSKPNGNTCSLTLDSCSFIRNVGDEGGCVMYEALSHDANEVTFNFTITTCYFYQNRINNGDGCIYNVIISFNGIGNILITGSDFQENYSSNYHLHTGSIYSSQLNVQVDRSRFIGNRGKNSPTQLCMTLSALSDGGASTNHVGLQVTNSIFAGNSGGIATQSGTDNYVTSHITNCTFFNNKNYLFVKGWFSAYNDPASEYYNRMYLDNNIIWEPGISLQKLYYNSTLDNPAMYGFRINNCLVSQLDSTSVIWSKVAYEYDNIFGANPGFADPAAGDFTPSPCSEAVDAGNNAAAWQAGLVTDIVGNPRILYDRVDIGAFEQPDTCASIAIIDLQIPTGTLEIWPNPSENGLLHLRVPDTSGDVLAVQVFDAGGRLVYVSTTTSEQVIEVDLEALPPGLYVVRVHNRAFVLTGKWVRG